MARVLTSCVCIYLCIMLLGFCLHKNALGFFVKHIYKMLLGFIIVLWNINVLFNIVVCNMLYYIVYKVLYNT